MVGWRGRAEAIPADLLSLVQEVARSVPHRVSIPRDCDTRCNKIVNDEVALLTYGCDRRGFRVP